MSIYRSLSHLAAEWRTAREEANTRRIIASLPQEIQKDIGWPEGHARQAYNPSLGSWAGGQ